MKVSGKIEKLCCAHCASLMQEKIENIKGVQAVSISFITQRILLEADEDMMDEIVAAADKAVRSIEPDCKLAF